MISRVGDEPREGAPTASSSDPGETRPLTYDGMVSADRGGPDPLGRLVPASTCRVPPPRSGIIERDDVVKRLIDAQAPLVMISAPPGYGKTTTAALWAGADPRPFGWVALGRPDADIRHLVWHIAAALTLVQPISDKTVDLLAGAGRSIGGEVIPALLRAVEVMDSFVLVLDDAHRLTSPDAVRFVEALVGALPDGAAIALLGRNVAAFDVARRRVNDELFELGARDLAMSADVVGRLFEWAGHDLGDDRIADLVERTEGWPAALHLAELSLGSSGGSGSGTVFSGRDRLVADYLVEEVLGELPEPTVWFLERSAVLDRMSAPLLDDLLGVDTSGETLDAIERAGILFLVPLDNERRWYRYHHLFADLLRSRLERSSPVEATRLRERASRLLEAAGDVDAAIDQAVQAGDPRRAADLILGQAAPTVLRGRTALISRWLEDLGPSAFEVDPVAAMGWGWVGFGTGDRVLVQGALRAARAAAGRMDGGARSRLVVPCGDLFGAIVGDGGVVGTIEQASAVIAADVADPVWQTIAKAVRGFARAVSGESESARIDLLHTLPLLGGLPLFDSGVRAHLALLDLDEGDFEQASRWAHEGLDIAHRERLEGMPAITVVFAVGALVLALTGSHAASRAEFATAASLLDRLGGGSARTALLGHAVLASAALLLDDRSRARVHLDEGERASARYPGAHQLDRMLDDTRVALATDRSLRGRPALTPAELRLLPLLATHLGLQEIADELYVSRNTVKSQAMAVYRKLGVSSRSEAVVIARELGLLGP